MERYKESGGVGPAGILLAFVGLPVATALMAYAYQWVQEKSLTQFAHAFVPMVFGAAAGLTAGAAILGGKVRGRALRWAVVATAVVAGDAASFYWSWKSDAARLYGVAAEAADAPATGSRPRGLRETYRDLGFSEWLALRVEFGWVDIREPNVSPPDWRAERARAELGLPPPPPPPPLSLAPDAMLRRMRRPEEPKGGFVILSWAGEFLFMAAAALFAARFFRPPPYCAACKQWAVARPLRRITSVDTQALRAAARTGDMQAFLEPKRGERASVSGCRVLHACPRCRDSGWLDVGYAEEAAAGKSAVSHATWLATQLVLTPDQRRGLEEREDSVARGREQRGGRS